MRGSEGTLNSFNQFLEIRKITCIYRAVAMPQKELKNPNVSAMTHLEPLQKQEVKSKEECKQSEHQRYTPPHINTAPQQSIRNFGGQISSGYPSSLIS